MLTLLAYAMVIVFMALIMTDRLSALLALILVPVGFALIGAALGVSSVDIGPMVLNGIRNLAPTGVLLLFAILYFGLMIDAGLFDPVARTVLRLVHGDPVRIVVGTAVLATLVSLDGDSSTSYIITTTAMLPLYRRLGMNPLIAACVIMLAAGNTNLTPWGGPTARAASALHVDVNALFLPLVPTMVGCFLFSAWPGSSAGGSAPGLAPPSCGNWTMCRRRSAARSTPSIPCRRSAARGCYGSISASPWC
jgi:CitMHS family citrate-Mg2+:H+ or citrate-Ca2+:H+ symporter